MATIRRAAKPGGGGGPPVAPKKARTCDGRLLGARQGAGGACRRAISARLPCAPMLAARAPHARMRHARRRPGAAPARAARHLGSPLGAVATPGLCSLPRTAPNRALIAAAAPVSSNGAATAGGRGGRPPAPTAPRLTPFPLVLVRARCRSSTRFARRRARARMTSAPVSAGRVREPAWRGAACAARGGLPPFPPPPPCLPLTGLPLSLPAVLAECNYDVNEATSRLIDSECACWSRRLALADRRRPLLPLSRLRLGLARSAPALLVKRRAIGR